MRSRGGEITNNPSALEKKMQESGRECWELTHVTSITAGGGGDIVTSSRIYLFWERDEPRKNQTI